MCDTASLASVAVTRPRTIHRCTECGSGYPRWSGRCGACGEWNSLVEEPEEQQRAASRLATGGAGAGGPGWAPAGPVPLASIDAAGSHPLPTGLDELDRVLGGGLVPGSVTLVGGEPGIGKSTLLLQCLAGSAEQGRRTLLVAGEESVEQVRRRADRLGAAIEGVSVIATTDLAAVFEAVEAVEPALLLVDSIQTLADTSLAPAAGTVTQVRECAAALVRLAKQTGVTVILVGHVTKDGALAGPRALEHVVDTVLTFEGERHHALRLLGATKHRFGATGELGVFEMTDRGLNAVVDPSGLLLGERRPGVPGCVVVPVAEGQRPLLLELQALVAPSSLPTPRRASEGVQSGRLALLVAVLEKRLGLAMGSADIFVSVVGGVRVTEPAMDLGIGLALVSAVLGVPIPADTVVCGEVGLGGELRQVGRMPQRLAEACRLGFGRAIVAQSAPAGPAGMQLLRAGTLAEAVELAISEQGRPTATTTAGSRPSPRGRAAPASGANGSREDAREDAAGRPAAAVAAIGATATMPSWPTAARRR